MRVVSRSKTRSSDELNWGQTKWYTSAVLMSVFFFFQAEDGIRDYKVTGVQTCALPISRPALYPAVDRQRDKVGCWFYCATAWAAVTGETSPLNRSPTASTTGPAVTVL